MRSAGTPARGRPEGPNATPDAVGYRRVSIRLRGNGAGALAGSKSRPHGHRPSRRDRALLHGPCQHRDGLASNRFPHINCAIWLDGIVGPIRGLRILRLVLSTYCRHACLPVAILALTVLVAGTLSA